MSSSSDLKSILLYVKEELSYGDCSVCKYLEAELCDITPSSKHTASELQTTLNFVKGELSYGECEVCTYLAKELETELERASRVLKEHYGYLYF